jgi:hypothetical protein
VQRVRKLSASLEQLHGHGWTRLPAAFNPDAAAAMREAVWEKLRDDGIDRDDPTTWTVERPAPLQSLRSHPAFREVASPTVVAAIDAIMEGRAYPAPKDWGPPFIDTPAKRV